MSDDTIPQDQLAEVNNLVDESYNNPQNNEVQQLALRSSLRFLSKLGNDSHIFCNPDLEKAAIKSLMIFAYPNTSHLAAYQSFLAGQLARCPQCPRRFHLALIEFEKIMSDTYNYENEMIEELMQLFEQWNRSRITESLSSTYEKIKDITDPKPSEFQEELIPLFECLCAPRLFRDEKLHDMFKKVFFKIQKPNSPTIRPPELLPGVVMFLFSKDDDERMWAEITVNKIKPSEFSTAATFDAMLVQAIDDVIEEASTNPMSEADLERFWGSFNVLIRVLDRSVFTEKLSGRPHDALRFLAGCILKLPKQSLPATLLAFSKAVDKIGSTIWTLITPVSVEYIVNAIRGNLFFSNPLSWSSDSPGDVISWVNPLLKSCDSTNLQRCGQTIIPLLIDQLGSKGPAVEEIILTQLLNVFCLCLKTEMREVIPFISQVQRLQRTPVKHLVYQHASIILDSYFKYKVTNIHIPSLALNIIYHSILLDVLTGTPENPGLKDSPTIPEEEKPKNGLVSLWSQLNKRLTQDSDLAIHILRALKGVSFIMRPPPRKPTEVQVMPRGIFSSQAIDNAIVSMQLIGEFDKEFLQPVLLDDEALLAIILNTYSVHQEVNQSAVDIFCQAFDADDRLTALSSMLNYDLKRSLAVLTSAVKMVTTVAIFPPCPKLIKVAQDVSQCLFGAQAGILNKKKEGIAFELLSYWQTNWKFLEKMFKTTPKWAVHFKNDFMLEFMRDLLDYSGELVDYYRLLEAMMPADMDESTSTNYLLLNSVIDCLTEMCRLLRLKDESLILSCFNIIVSVLGLMRSFDVKPSKALVQIFVQLSSKARGFENIMTSDQLTRLLVDSGAYTSEEAERVVRGSTPEEKEVVEVRQVKKAAQRSIMDFARPGAVQRLVGKPIPPVVQAISGSAPRTSMMDTLRAEVKSRNALKPIAPSKEIHPARPPGFNNSKFGRKAAVESKTATGSSSDEDSSDDSDDDGLFTIKQVLNSNSLHKLRNIEKKPVSAINLGPNHRKVGTDISEKEREERNMMARLQIDLGPLHQQILSWDYHATGDKPIVQKTGQLFATNTRQVPDTFKTVNEYQEVFEPLLMLECWQNIQRSKMEANDKPFKITIANKTLVGNGAYEVRASLPVSSWQECKIGDSDVLVLSYFTGDNVDARYPSKDVPYCLAKIKEIKNTNTDYVELAMRVDNPPLSMHTYLVPLAEFHVLRTVSLTTIEREYCSLRALQYYDLKSEILNALPSKTQDASAERIRKTVSTYNVNESQAKAIISSHYSQGFSLIQGPPGTGKTKTILGIVGSFLTETTSGSPLPPPPAAGQDLKNPDLENLKRILICAPSNAAVDELVLRLKNGVIGHGGKLIKPGIVRLGRSDVINPSVRELTLEELVEQKLNELDDNSNKELMGALRKEQNQTLAERDKLRQEQNATEDPAKREALRLEILALTKTIKATGHKLDLQREQLQVRARKRDIERRKAQAQIIKQSQIICATLSGSAHNVLSSLKMRFDTVIIDEAAQCIELSALIPLKYGCKQCIMVGDPNQLPPTVLSQQAASLKYEQSLFVRMFNKHQDRVHMLNVQFRMHPDIAEFPSKEFYNGKLETGSTNLERTKKVWHDRSLFSPYRFFNVKGSHERSERTKSLFNKKEAMVAFQLYRALENKIGHSEIAGKVGIISPYKQQVNLLKRVFKTELGELGAADIDFNTIDGFQGQEKEVIIISCVRAEPDGYGVGFLGDTRRMNVAVTRAKSALWILGNEESLLKNPVWRRLVADAKQRHCYTDCKPGQLNNLIRNGDQAAHQEKRKFEDDDQSGRKKKKPKSRDDRRVDNRQRNDFNKNRDDKKDRSRNERRDNRPERDARPVDDDDNYEPSLPTGPRQYRDSSSAAATPVQSNYNSRTPSTEHSAAASGSVTPSAQPVGVQNNEPIHEEDGYEPRPASQKPETPVVTGKNDDDDDYEPRPVSQRTVPMKVDDDDSYEPQLGSASLPTSVAPAGGIDDYEPRPPTQRPDVAARNINKVVPLVRRPPPPNQQVRGAPLPLPTMPLPGRPVGPTGVIPPVGPASLMAPSGPAGSSLPTRPSSMKNNSTNMNKFPFNKYQGTAVKKKNRNKKPANVLLPSKRAGPATGNMNTNNNNSNNNKNNNNNNNGPGNNSNRPNNKKNPRNGNNNKPKNKRPGPGPGPGPGAVPSVPTNLNNINNNGRPIPKPY